MKNLKFVTVKIKKCFKWLNKNSVIQNKRWYVFPSYIITWLGLFISIYTLSFPIQNIQNQINELKYDFPKVYNQQSVEFKKIEPDLLIKKYYEYLNIGDYQNACSLISTFQCSMYDVNLFTKWVADKNRYLTIKMKDGEKLLSTWYSGISLPNTQGEIWCSKIEYTLSNESEPVHEIRQITIANRPDGYKEIRRTLCEKTFKNGQDRSVAMDCNQVTDKICVKSNK